MRCMGSTDRMVIRGLLLCLMSVYLSGCMAGAAMSVISQTVKTTAKAAGTAVRITMDGARAASHTIIRSFRKGADETAPAK